MLVKKQMKYFDVPSDHAWKVPVLQEFINTRTNIYNNKKYSLKASK